MPNALNLTRLIRRRASRVVAIRGHALPLDKLAQALCADLHVLRLLSRVAVPIERDIARVAPGSIHFAVPSWVFALTGGGCSPFGFGRKSDYLRAIADFVALYDEALA
jgi:hypothetical protein